MADDADLEWVAPYWVAQVRAKDRWPLVQVLNGGATTANVTVRFNTTTGALYEMKVQAIPPHASRGFFPKPLVNAPVAGWVHVASDAPVVVWGRTPPDAVSDEGFVKMGFSRHAPLPIPFSARKPRVSSGRRRGRTAAGTRR